jgi:hypothetical protein
MTEERYSVYKIHYGIPDNIDLFAEVSPTGLISQDSLTESEILLKEDIEKRGKSIEGYVLYSIEKPGTKSDITGVISNTLKAVN